MLRAPRHFSFVGTYSDGRRPSVTAPIGGRSLRASSPLRSSCLKTNWLNGMKQDVLDGRTLSTSRTSASDRTIKISASIATTFSDRKQPNGDAGRVDLFLQKNVIRSTIATSNPTVASLADRDTRQGSSALMTNRGAGFHAVTRPAPRSYGTVGPSRNFLKSGWASRNLKSSARGGPIFPVSCHVVGSKEVRAAQDTRCSSSR